jgi:hypothetical protein
MKTLFETSSADELIARVNNLNLQSQPLWGKMNIGQMLAHCSSGVQMAHGTRHFSRVFIGRIIGSFIKKKVLTEMPMHQNSPTHKEMLITEIKDFEKEKENLVREINHFVKSGRQEVKDHTHPFFGKMSIEEWGIIAYKHLDHHIRQFGA